jgi:hypothetical protein
MALPVTIWAGPGEGMHAKIAAARQAIDVARRARVNGAVFAQVVITVGKRFIVYSPRIGMAMCSWNELWCFQIS